MKNESVSYHVPPECVTALFFSENVESLQTLISLMSQCVSLAIAMVLYFTRSVMKMIEVITHTKSVSFHHTQTMSQLECH
jgi:hypothetical protein